MRSKLQLIFMELNYQLLKNNTVGKNSYAIFQIIHMLQFTSFSLEFMLNKSTSSLIQRYFDLNNAILESVNLVLVGLILLTAIVYCYCFVLLYKAKKTDQQNTFQSIYQHPKLYYQFIMIMFLLNQTVFALPNKVLSIKVVIKNFQIQQNPALIGISVVLFILDISSTLFFSCILQTIYPIESVPWATPFSHETFLNQISMILYSIALSLTRQSQFTPYLYGISFLFTGITFCVPTTYYVPLTNILHTFCHSFLLLSQFTMTIFYASPDNHNQTFYVFFYVILGSTIFIGKQNIVKQMQQNILIKSNKVLNQATGIRWMWLIYTSYYEKPNQLSEKLIPKFKDMQNLINRHIDICDQYECICKFQKVIKLMQIRRLKNNTYEVYIKAFQILLEIALYNFKSEAQCTQEFQQTINQTNDEKSSKNSIYKFQKILIYMKNQTNSSLMSSLYNILRSHYCTKCQFIECYQNFILKNILFDQVNLNLAVVQETIRQESKYSQFINYESNLRDFVQSMQIITLATQDYWTKIQKNELDLVQAQYIGRNLIKEYKKFNKTYNIIKESCGEVLIIEHLALKMHNEVMQFEFEALQNEANLKNLYNKYRITKESDISQLENISINQKLSLVVVSCNPQNFMFITLASHSFVKLTGYKEETLLKSRLNLILPLIIDKIHDDFVIEYLTSGKSNQLQAINKRQWLRNNEGTISQYDLIIVPRINQKDGISFLTFVQQVKKVTINELELDSKIVLCMIADINNKIVHMSENFAELLNISPNFSNSDIFIQTLLKDLPNLMLNDTLYDARFDISAFDNQDQQIKSLQFHTISQNQSGFKAKVLYKEYDYRNQNIIKEFYIVLLKNQDQTDNIKQFDTQSAVLQNFSQHNSLINVTNNSFQFLESNDSEEGAFRFMSQSSASSSLSNTSQTSYSLVSDIKCQIQFQVIPHSLKMFKIRFIIGYALIIASAILLLIINIKAKEKFFVYFQSLVTEKNLRNSFSMSKMSLIFMYGLANLPDQYQNNDGNYFGVNVTENNYTSFFGQSLNDNLEILHQQLSEFSLYQANWDKDFIQLVTIDKLKSIQLSQNGNYLNITQTFLNSLNQFIQRTGQLSDFPDNLYKVDWNIFQYTSSDDYRRLVQSLQNNLGVFISILFTVLSNNSLSFILQMLKVDKVFMINVLQQGNYQVSQILAITIAVCCLVIIINIILLPYYFSIQNVEIKAVEFAQNTDIAIAKVIVKNAQDFSIYLETNQYLESMNSNYQNYQRQPTYKKRKITTNQNIEELISQDYKSQYKKGNLHNPITQTANEFQSQNQLINTIQQNCSKNQKFIPQDFKEEKNMSKSLLVRNQNKKFEQKLHQANNQSKQQNVQNDARNNNESEAGQQTSKEIEQNDIYSLNNNQKIIKKQKQKYTLKVLSIIMLVISLLVSFFVITFIVSKNTYTRFQDAFSQYNVFYTHNQCFAESLFFIQQSILFNKSMQIGTTNGNILDTVINICTENQKNYRDIRRANSNIFSKIMGELKIQDSDQFCDYIGANNINNSECQTSGNGILKFGFLNFRDAFNSQIQKIRIDYNSLPVNQRTLQYLSDKFYDKDTIDYSLIFIKYLKDTNRMIQIRAQLSLNRQMNEMFMKIIVTFSILTIFFVVLLVILQYKIVKYFHFKLLRIRMLMKLIPSSQIVDLKQKLGNFNVKQI